MEEIEKVLRERLGWNEIMMSNIMWRYIGVNVDELTAYGIDPHAWIEVLHRLTVNDTYMLGAVHGDVYVKPTMPCCYEISASTTSTMGVLYFEELMRRIRMPTVEFSTRRRTPNVIYVRFYVELSKKAWPWYEGYEIISSFNMDELRKYVSGLIDTDGSVTVDKQKCKYKFEIDIASADTKFLEFLSDVIHERLGITGSIKLGIKGVRGSILRFRGYQAIQLYEELRQYLAHPMKRLKAETYMKYYNKEMPKAEYQRFYEQFKYHHGFGDPKRYRAAILLAQAAPQTHTHGESNLTKSLLPTVILVATPALPILPTII